MLPFQNFFKTLIWTFRTFPLDILEATLKNKMYLKGLSQKEINTILPEFYNTYLKPNFYGPVYRKMNELKKADFQIIFISATLDFILNQMVEGLCADGGVAATTEIRKGLFTGRLLGTYPYFSGKVKAMNRYLDGQKVDFKNSYAFADRWEDIPLLSIFGHPVAVNPTWRLRKEAQKRGWTILSA